MDAMTIARKAAMICDRIWLNARLATLRSDQSGTGDVPDGIVACRNARIVYAGAAADAPSDLDATERIDCAGRWITPGLIDCHTHIIYAGDRSHEFELRLEGARATEEIARAGGGILSTMRATRAASEEALVDSALPRRGCVARRRGHHNRGEVGLRSGSRQRAQMLRAAHAWRHGARSRSCQRSSAPTPCPRRRMTPTLTSILFVPR